MKACEIFEKFWKNLIVSSSEKLYLIAIHYFEILMKLMTFGNVCPNNGKLKGKRNELNELEQKPTALDNWM